MNKGFVHADDSKTFPIEDTKRALRKFGDKHHFRSAEVLSKALDLPLGTLTGILYSTTAKRISGVTKREIETAIRNYDPTVCPEKVIFKKDFARVLNNFAKEYGLKKSEMAKILDVPASTLSNWTNPNRSEDFRAKTVRPILIKMREYRVARGRNIGKAMESSIV